MLRTGRRFHTSLTRLAAVIAAISIRVSPVALQELGRLARHDGAGGRRSGNMCGCMKWCTFLAAALALAAADQSVLESRKAEIGALLEKRDFATALRKAKEINRACPDDISGYQLLAAAHLGIGNYAEAEPALQWMIDLRIGKADAQGWLLVARFREVTGDIEGASDAVNAGYARLGAGEERQRVALLALSGRLQFLSGKLDAAARGLHEALAVAPSD